MITVNWFGFKLELSFIGDWSLHSYRFWDFNYSEDPLFEGEDFRSGGAKPESIEAIAALLGFLSLREGDTDDDYFAKYSTVQTNWTKNDSRIDELSSLENDLEEDLGRIINEVYNLSHGDIVEWDDWKDDEDYIFPIRLQDYEDRYKLWIGDSSFDTDHRGEWDSTFIHPEMTLEDCFDVVAQMHLQLRFV